MEFELSQAIAVLERTPSALRALLNGLPANWVDSSGDREAWRPYDVLGHLIHGERSDWIPRARIILDQGESHPFEPFDRVAMFEESRGKTLEELLDEFERRRGENLERLASWQLSAEDLDKSGRHPELGRVTLRQLLATWSVHDLNHLAQISRAMASEYADEVGPWKEYLSILRG